MTANGQPWAQWIGDDTVAMLYAEGIKRWGGAGSFPQAGCTEAALGAAYNAELYSPESEQEGGVQGLIFASTILSGDEALLYRWKQADCMGLHDVRAPEFWADG